MAAFKGSDPMVSIRPRQSAAMRRLSIPIYAAEYLTFTSRWHSAPVCSPRSLPTMPVTLFTFDNLTESRWAVVNDGVMGGRSRGAVAVRSGTLRFTGTLVTQGGGFTLTRAPCQANLTGQAGVELHVRGSGRRFQVEIDDGTRRFGRNVSRRADFDTSTAWTVVRVPFTALRSTIFGQAVSAPPIDLAHIQNIGLYMADGQDGPFALEVDFIQAYDTRG